VNLSVRVDATQAKRLLDELGQATPRIAAGAINKAGAKVRTFLKRAVAQDTGLQAGVVSKGIELRRATGRNLTASVVVTGRRIPLIEFGARGPEPSRGKGGGVSYRGKGGQRQRIPEAFIATMKSDHRGVFKRSTLDRLPIQELFGPSLPIVARSKADEAVALGERELVIELETALRFIRGQRAGGA
jgi:hypothetical protein